MPQLEHSLNFISSCVSRISAVAMYAIFATNRMKRVLHARRKFRGLWQMYARHVRPGSGLPSRRRRTARRINLISSSHEQWRASLLENAAPKCSRQLSVQKLWSSCTWYSRYLLVLVSSSARNNKRVHPPLIG